MVDDYLIEYSDVKNMTIKEFIYKINETKGKMLSELKLIDLTYYNSKPIWPGEGVYVFREKEEPLYVGKASSMSFTERIGKHLDFRNKAWFNRMLKLIHTDKLGLELDKGQPNFHLSEASEYAFKNMNLVLINFEDRQRINRTERMLRSYLEPLNKFKQLEKSSFDITLEEY